MKKSIICAITAVVILLACAFSVSATEINLCAPTEEEIVPGRDFYVVGTIDREGISAQSEPLDIKIELINAKGDVIRSIQSNVSIDGLTAADYFLTDYEYATSYNDSKETFINKFTPPDIIYDGVDRDSIRLSHNKVVVKENYFAAIIFGGASKEFDLKYEDEHENALYDISEGEYELVITALNSDGEEVCRYQQILVFSSDSDRLITSESLNEYASENSMVLSNSIVGYWDPAAYINENTNSFYYINPRRLLYNLTAEFSNSENVYIHLNNLNLSDVKTNLMFGSVYNEDSVSKPLYLYYDIGESKVKFTFSGAAMEKNGELIKNDYSKFIAVNRVETSDESGENSYVDFSAEDGVLITEGNSNVFYGVYSPVINSSVLSGNTYKITNNVAYIKAAVVNENNKVVFEQSETAGLIKNNSSYTSRYEFAISITPNKEMLESDKLTLTFYAVDKDGNELFSSDGINVKAIEYGSFVTGYDETYWGKGFCDGVNLFGQSPSGVSLNPDEHITRGDFASLVNRLMGYSIPGSSKFSDLDKDSIFYDDCITAYQAGYMTGDEKGEINADSLISREQAMIILARISGAQKGDNEIEFKDSSLISFWAKDYVDIMCSTGIVSGFDGYINPQNNITVAEAAALIIKTIRWMYSDEAFLPVGDGNNFVASDSSADLSIINVIQSGVISTPTEENISSFFSQNQEIFKAIKDYIVKNCTDGAYVGKVGNGLELRDYKWGSVLTFSADAVKIITDMGSCFSSFSIKYNPANSENLYFNFGKNREGKQIGIVYSQTGEDSGRKLIEISADWYYFIQE